MIEGLGGEHPVNVKVGTTMMSVIDGIRQCCKQRSEVGGGVVLLGFKS